MTMLLIILWSIQISIQPKRRHHLLQQMESLSMQPRSSIKSFDYSNRGIIVDTTTTTTHVLMIESFLLQFLWSVSRNFPRWIHSTFWLCRFLMIFQGQKVRKSERAAWEDLFGWRLFQLFNKFQTLFTRCVCINYNKNFRQSFYLLFILKLEENI